MGALPIGAKMNAARWVLLVVLVGIILAGIAHSTMYIWAPELHSALTDPQAYSNGCEDDPELPPYY